MSGGIPMGVCYRTGKLTVADYDEAIRDLTDARDQVASGSLMGCSCCGDSGHAVQDGCHHDPLYLARQWTAATHVWECWHCGYTATNAEQAEAHFGKTEFEFAACIAAHREAHTAGQWQPMETAPRDGTSILVVEAAKPNHPYLWEKRHQAVHQASFEDGAWIARDLDPLENEFFHVTHWRPLPAPPATDAAK